MKFQYQFIKSRIGRRIFSMFALCALFPIVVFGGISFFQVSKQLQKQSYERLQKEVKSHGLSIYERLIFLESELNLISLTLADQSQNGGANHPSVQNYSISARIKSLAIAGPNWEMFPIKGSVRLSKKDLSIQEKAHLKNGSTVLWIEVEIEGTPKLFMIQSLPGSYHDAEYVIAEIASEYLWGENMGNNISPLTDILVLGPSREILYSSVDYPNPFLSSVIQRISNEFAGSFDIAYNKENYSMVYRLVFIQPKFLFPGYMVILRQPKSFILEPITAFRHTFPAVVIVSLLVVLLLSVIYIRKSLVPLDVLKEGISRVADKKFHRRVELNSGDEFEELATSFNEMAGQLGRQFKALNTRSEIDRSILSSINAEEIIETALKGMQKIFENDSVVISLINQFENRLATSYVAVKGSTDINQVMVSYTPLDIEILKRNKQYVIFNQNKNLPRYLHFFAESDSPCFLILPVFTGEKASAAIILSRQDGTQYEEENIIQARQVADQVAVALSNSQLLEELHSLSWGTLVAFGRAVDAKSPWTAGHSERVAELAVKIGRGMNLDERKIDMLELAGILHDIGKIGVPAYILDKPAKLTSDEMDTIRKHPVIGARILEPINIFVPIIPMVLQHHEQFGGGGYPNQISGENIDLGARILAVADNFDALTSDRPYRKAMTMERAMSILSDGSGKMFDPEVLKAFNDIVDSEDVYPASGYVFIKNQIKFGT